jgi:hypothetical protein
MTRYRVRVVDPGRERGPVRPREVELDDVASGHEVTMVATHGVLIRTCHHAGIGHTIDIAAEPSNVDSKELERPRRGLHWRRCRESECTARRNYCGDACPSPSATEGSETRHWTPTSRTGRYRDGRVARVHLVRRSVGVHACSASVNISDWAVQPPVWWPGSPARKTATVLRPAMAPFGPPHWAI